MTNEKIFWFGLKRFGWGWVPITWQGWLSLLIYVLIILSNSNLFQRQANPTSGSWWAFWLINLAATIGLIWLCYKKGPTPKWQWK